MTFIEKRKLFVTEFREVLEFSGHLGAEVMQEPIERLFINII